VIQHFRENSVSLNDNAISLHASSLPLLMQTAPSVGKCLIIHMRPQTAKIDLTDQHHSTIQLKGATLKSTLFVLCMLQITKTFLIGTHRTNWPYRMFSWQIATPNLLLLCILQIYEHSPSQGNHKLIHTGSMKDELLLYVWWDDGLSHSLTWRKNSIWQRRDKGIALRM